jgi:multiple sugar transport system substrate-binding protein
MKNHQLSRREFLKYATLTSGAAVLAACTQATPEKIVETVEVPVMQTEIVKETVEVKETVKETVVVEATAAPTQAPQPKKVEGKVVVMHARNELTEEEQTQFETDNPGITIEFIQSDGNRFSAMMAAGTPPDMYRTVASSVAPALIKKQVLDLTPYFQVSSVLKIDDLAPANRAYWAEDALHLGVGKIYGITKDWSPMQTLFINTELFEKAGLDIPADDQFMSVAESGELARKLTQREGDRTLVWGFGGDPVDWNVDLNVWAHVAETEGVNSSNRYLGVLYDEVFTKINLTSNEKIKEAFKFYFDLAKERAMSSPVDPSSGWSGQDFADGKVAIAVEGYWFGAMAETDITRGKVKALPSRRWAADGKPLDACTATGAMISATTPNPDATWRVFEWYHGEQPAIARAKSGWGVPALMSLYSYLPMETEYDKQRYKVLQWELENVDCGTPIPQIPWGTSYWFTQLWNKQMEPAYRDEITYDEALVSLESEINGLLSDAFSRFK